MKFSRIEQSKNEMNWYENIIPIDCNELMLSNPIREKNDIVTALERDGIEFVCSGKSRESNHLS